MVSTDRLSEEPSPTQDDPTQQVTTWQDDDIISTSSLEHDEPGGDGGLDISCDDSCNGVFENIVIKNSSNVQFGNNSYYQGPVTIKQIVYKSSDDPLCIDDGKEQYNLGFEPDDREEKNFGTKEVVTDINTKSRFGSWWSFHTKTVSLVCVGLVFALLMLATVLFVSRQYFAASLSEGDAEANYTLSGKLRIVPRGEWIAQPPAQPADPLKTPVPYVIILHTATENCSDQATCVYHVRYIQTFHMESKGWWDIAYNFLVGGDGNAYEGRGWTSQGANAFGYNDRCIGIAFIGTFNSIRPPDRQILAAKQLIEMGVQRGYISPDYKLLAHRQVSSTQSPGEVLYEDIKTWPHWVKGP